MKVFDFLINKKLIFLDVIIVLLGVVSLYAGIDRLLYDGMDCQIEGAAWLLKGKSPYSLYWESRDYFRMSRVPTHLPQSYYILAPFALLGDYWGI